MTAWLVAAGALTLALALWRHTVHRRRKRLIESFAEARGLIHAPHDDGRLRRVLDYAFELAAPSERIFFDIHDLATDGDIVLFRMSEQLDLGNRIKTRGEPLERIAATFSVPADIDLFFMVSRRLNVKNAHPDRRDPQSDIHFARLRQVLNERPLPHPLSVTMGRGRALLYLLPRRPGVLADGDLEFLFGLAKRLEGVFRAPTASAARRSGPV
ncbi:MAG: hypothetical protein MJE12_19130 [Alphaproteobacteria bacterium]|nr:hypothetical protein [Alphaproteobacteria bacterium]